MAISHVKVDTIADFTGTVTVYNSQGSTQTVNATGLVRPSDWNSVHNQYMTISGNTVGGSTLSGSNIVFQGAGALTLSGNADTLVFSAPAQSVQTQGAVSVQGSTGAIVFSNSNNVTFGGNASTITASASFNQTVQTQGSVQVQGSSGAISFANGNGITFGGNASTITASHNGLTTARASNDAIGLNTALTANGVAWTVNSSGLSLNVPAFLTTAAQSDHSHGNPTLALTNLSGTTASNSAGLTLSLSAAAPGGGGGPAISAAGGSGSTGTIVFSNSNGVSFGWNAGTITATVEPGAAAGIAAVAAGTQQGTSGTVTFVNSNGITFGMSGSSQITASHNGLTTARASNDAIGLNSAFTAGPLAMTINSSGLSLNAASAAGTSTGFGGNLLSASMTHNTAGLNLSMNHPAWLTTAAQSNHSHGNPTLALTNLSGTTASNSAGLTLSLSAAAPGGAASVTMYATGNTTQSSTGTQALSSMIVQGTGGVSAGISNGSIVISGPTLTSLSVTGALSASSNGSTISLGVGTVTVSGTSNTTQASSGTVNLNGLIFAGAGGASVGISNGSIVISGATGGGGGGAGLSAGTQSVSTGTVAFANSNGITFGMSNSNQITASYNSTQFAGQGTTFAGANISASMTLNSNGLNLSASVAAPGAAAENNAINLLGANTAGNTTATGSTIGWSGLNLTLSGTNASQVVISAPATSSIVGASGIGISTAGSTISIYQNIAQQSFFMAMPANASTFVSQVGNGTVAVYPVVREGAFSASRADIWASVSVSSSSNSSHAGVLSVYAGIYTRNGSTLSLASSGSQSYQWSNTSNNSLGSIASLRQFSIPINVNYTGGGDLWVAVMSRSSTTNANWFTASNILQSSGGHSGQVIGLIGDASNATRGPLGFGRFSASSTVLPSSMGFSQITGGQGGTASASRLMPNVFFQNFTA